MKRGAQIQTGPPGRALLYEVNVRCWLRELGELTGSPAHLGDVPDDEFNRWRRLGFTHIWLMGVWTTGPRSRNFALHDPDLRRSYDTVLPGWTEDDIGGSPYSVAAYTVPPELGGDEGLARFRQRLNQRGMALILDFVPNHVGLDHAWLDTRPEVFVTARAGEPGAYAPPGDGGRWFACGKDPFFPAWRDTVQLDYRRPETQRAMQRELLSVAARCDGVRCDMAMLLMRGIFERTWSSHPCPVPHTEREFWPAAIRAVKAAHPGFQFLAEVYWDLDAQLQQLGFDYTYDKWLYDHLVHDNHHEAQQHLLDIPGGGIVRGIHFLENHDEPRAAAHMTWAEHRAAAVLVAALPGMILLHDGQLTGATRHLPVQLRRRPQEAGNPSIRAFYEWLLHTLRTTAVGHGDWRILRTRPAWRFNDSHRDIIIVQWQSEPDAFDLAIVNLAPWDAQTYVRPAVKELTKHQWRMEDLLGTEKYVRNGREMRDPGLYLALPGKAAQMFHFSPAA